MSAQVENLTRVVANFGRLELPAASSTLSAGTLGTYNPISRSVFQDTNNFIRGTGKTLPFSCFPTEDGAVSLGSTSANASDAAAGQLWAEGGIVSQVCYDQLKDYGDLVGMAHTARDMNEIVDALCEDGMLKYWGEFRLTKGSSGRRGLT